MMAGAPETMTDTEYEFLKLVLVQLGEETYWRAFNRRVTTLLSDTKAGTSDRELKTARYHVYLTCRLHDVHHWNTIMSGFIAQNPMRLLRPRWPAKTQLKLPFSKMFEARAPGALKAKLLRYWEHLHLSDEAKVAFEGVGMDQAFEETMALRRGELLPTDAITDAMAQTLASSPASPVEYVDQQQDQQDAIEFLEADRDPASWVVTKETWKDKPSVSSRDEIVWVKDHLALRKLKPQDCPSAGAWAMLLQARESPADFWRIWQGQAAKEDDGTRAKDKLREMTERQIEECQAILQKLLADAAA
jgi:hypothetical protein